LRSGAAILLALSLGCGGSASVSRREVSEVHRKVTVHASGEKLSGQARRFDFNVAASNASEHTLLIRQGDLRRAWRVNLNGEFIGRLQETEQPVIHAVAVRPGALREGANVLTVVPPSQGGDVSVGPIELEPRPLREALSQAWLEVEVNGGAFPCRITVADREGALGATWVEPHPALAVRSGVVYARDGRARIGAPPGAYTVYASRGFEWGVDAREVEVKAGARQPVKLTIRREVPTPGLVACDTHVHTLAYSKNHGDATLDERVITLAGEGVELPVATEHNQHRDYTLDAMRMEVGHHFTAVPGNEVTTASGHFNIFPVVTTQMPPDPSITDWPRLMEAIRESTGAKVVILNHPRDVHQGFRPFDEKNFNPVTGENRRGFAFGFNAIEVANSGALRSDVMEPFRDWMAVLNSGVRATAVGSSDCHDVSRYIVGQGRTYVACKDDDVGKLNVEEAAKSIREGRATVSLGLLAQISLDDRYKPGDIATGLGDQLKITVTVLGPSWTKCDRVELFLNGVKVREEVIAPKTDVEKAKVECFVPRPAHDMHLVAIATGPGVTAPFWPLAKPYQPTSSEWTPRVVAATNPIWLDMDGDGRFTPARAYADKIVRQHHASPTFVIPALGAFDEAVAAQAASLCQSMGKDVQAPEWVQLLNAAPEPVRKGFLAFAATVTAK
jgi:hypothetical protein